MIVSLMIDVGESERGRSNVLVLAHDHEEGKDARSNKHKECVHRRSHGSEERGREHPDPSFPSDANRAHRDGCRW